MSHCAKCRKSGGCEHTDAQFPYSMPGEMLRLERTLQDTRAEVAALKAQLAAVTEERDDLAEYVERVRRDNASVTAEVAKQRAEFQDRAESAEAALETCRLVGVSIVRRADCDGWAVTNQRACDAEAALLFLREKLCPDVTVWPDVPHDVACAILDRVREAESVAAGANRALREALLKRCPKHCNADHEDGACEMTRREVAALAAPPVADPRAEALASALERALDVCAAARDERTCAGMGLRDDDACAPCHSRAALDAWRGR